MALKFEREKRLLRKKEYLRLYEGSQVSRFSRGLIVRKANDRNFPRLGISVKNSRTSILRNLLKRRVRDIFRSSQERLGSFDYHVVIRAEDMNRQEVRETTDSLKKAFCAIA